MESINESFFTKETIAFNLDKWNNTDNNVLFITGLSGGGKSTLGKRIAEKNNAILLEYDIFFSTAKRTKEEFEANKQVWVKKKTNNSRQMHKLVLDFLESRDDAFNYITHENLIKGADKKQLAQLAKICSDFTNKIYEAKINEKIVAEGVQIIGFDVNLFKDRPLIIVGTGLASANNRAVHRYFENHKELSMMDKLSQIKTRTTATFSGPFKEASKDLDMFRKNAIHQLGDYDVFSKSNKFKEIDIPEIGILSEDGKDMTPLKKAILNEKRNGNYGDHYKDGNGRIRSAAEIYRIEQSQEAKAKQKAEDRQKAAEESAKRKQDRHDAYEQKRYELDVLSPEEWEEKHKEKYPYYEKLKEELEYMGVYDKYPSDIRKDYDAVDNKDIKTIIDAVKDIEYGYIDINDDHRETNRDYIHGFAKRTDDNLLNHYRLEVNPINTLVHKIGICGDQTICIKYLVNSILDGYECHGYALRKGRYGHAVPGFKTPTGEWYYLENAWDKERGLHGPFKSEAELMTYFDYLYHKHHDKDNDDPVTVERWNCLMEELYCDTPIDFEILNESVESRKMFADYNEYLKQHIGNVKKGFDWIKQYCPEMLEKVKVGKVESLIRTHDRSKYSRAEYEPYAQYFYGDKEKWKEEFDKACQHHYKHNKHHPEFWHGTYMPEEYIIEMICDWWSFSWKENKLGNIFNFFYNKKDEFEKKIHPQSFARLQELLKMLRKKLNKLDLI